MQVNRALLYSAGFRISEMTGTKATGPADETKIVAEAVTPEEKVGCAII
jgi:hypothetical protein